MDLGYWDRWVEFCGSQLTVYDLYFFMAMFFLVMLPCGLLYYAIRRSTAMSVAEQKFWGKEILLVVAKPTDAIHYFVPSLIELSKYNEVTVLALSAGGQSHEQAQEELEQACKVLKVEPPIVVDDFARLKHGGTWAVKDILTVL